MNAVSKLQPRDTGGRFRPRKLSRDSLAARIYIELVGRHDFSSRQQMRSYTSIALEAANTFMRALQEEAP